MMGTMTDKIRVSQIGWGLAGLVFYIRRKQRVTEALREAREVTPP